MLIINADDFGGWKSATDAIVACFDHKALSSASAMVFMEDSNRAAELARNNNFNIGLHLNFDTPFTSAPKSAIARASHGKLINYFTRRKLSTVIYNPLLSKYFSQSIAAQLEEFYRLYGSAPAHIDGHRHLHLCANVVWENLLPEGIRIRRNFSFFKGEKSFVNRKYRQIVDGRLSARCVMTDYFFSLESALLQNTCEKIVRLAESSQVELMTHPEKQPELAFLLSKNNPLSQAFSGHDGNKLQEQTIHG